MILFPHLNNGLLSYQPTGVAVNIICASSLIFDFQVAATPAIEISIPVTLDFEFVLSPAFNTIEEIRDKGLSSSIVKKFETTLENEEETTGL